MTSTFKFLPRFGEASDWAGFLDRGAHVAGTLEVQGTFRLDGTLKGRILSQYLLVLGEASDVEGEIETERVVIYGRFRGTLRASGPVEIHSSAVVSGDIYTSCLILEPGGRFDGHCYLKGIGAKTEPLLVPIRTRERSAET